MAMKNFIPIIKKLSVGIAIVMAFTTCKSKVLPTPLLFEVLTAAKTGINFENKLTPTAEFNLFKYLYYYNGAGVAAGDFNNDGKVDLFFTANQSLNKMYLNKGNMQFEDVTIAAKIPNDKAWNTGASVVDINNDGLLDIYISRVGNYDVLKSKNQFLICKGIDKNGVPFYEEEAEKMGVAFSGLSTQAAFLDYDMDGDLDMYLMNHSLRYTGTYNERSSYFNSFDSLTGDYLFQNQTNPQDKSVTLKNVTTNSGITGYIIGYGLGVAVADINMDGWPDIYIGNDFHENDYLYINQKNGTFKEVLTEQTRHTSQFSMGVDVADINNDALPEIISVDMMPQDPYILKRSLGEDEYITHNVKQKFGYHPQFARNALQMNRGDGLFSEVGLYSGVFATDWSWAPLFVDFDNDGLKDIFISNGIPKRMNDFDYINYISNEEVQQRARNNQLDETDLKLISKFPEIKIPNKFYLNKGDFEFEDVEQSIGNNKSTFSNSTVYADFDNDGDLDIAVNNINEAAFIYENKVNSPTQINKPFLNIYVKGSEKNINANGTKLIVCKGEERRVYEKYPVRGFQGSMEIPLQVGLANGMPDSLLLIWPDNTYQQLHITTSKNDTIKYQAGLPAFNYSTLTKLEKFSTPPVENIAASIGLNYIHKENDFNEFDREPLIPFMASKEGPALAIGDINGDKLDDVFIGSSKSEKPSLYIQTLEGKFINKHSIALDSDSTYEDVDAKFADVNGDSFLDLVVASGGNEYYGMSSFLLSRLYMNDGKGNFTKNTQALPEMFLTASCVLAEDFTGDGYVDLFFGGRAVPWQYGEIPPSYLLKNNGKGLFTDVTKQYCPALPTIGMVKDANWIDISGDKKPDLLLALEWGNVVAFTTETTQWKQNTITDKKGWWNSITPFDADGDGDMDLIAGNIGLNTRLKASAAEPVKMYYADFDNNGKKEQVITYFLSGKETVFATKEELQKQLPYLKKKYLYAADFASASLNELFGKAELKKAAQLKADYFGHLLLINDGKGTFSEKPLPWQVQLFPIRGAVADDVNGDNIPDLLLATNFYACNIQLGKYDADYGTVLVGKGKGNFKAEQYNQFNLKSEGRKIKKIFTQRKPAYILATNNDAIKVLRFKASLEK
jgi:hypothetical protein